MRSTNCESNYLPPVPASLTDDDDEHVYNILEKRLATKSLNMQPENKGRKRIAMMLMMAIGMMVMMIQEMVVVMMTMRLQGMVVVMIQIQGVVVRTLMMMMIQGMVVVMVMMMT